MAGLLDTFATIPPGSAAVPTSIADTFVVLLAQSFALGIRAAVPVVTALLLVHLGDGADQPHAAAVEHPGGRLRHELDADLRRPGALARRGRLGVPGPSRAGRGDRSSKPCNAPLQAKGLL